MNRSVIFFVFALLLSMTSVIAANPEISFDSDPYPCHANDVVEFSFRITNDNTYALSNVVFSLDVDDPFTLTTNSDQTISLAAGESRTITYNAYVDGSADEGKEEITLNYRIGSATESEDFEIQIAPRNVYLQITDMTSSPAKVAPGQTANIAIKVKNTAESDIKDMTVRLGISNLPFSSKNTAEQHLDTLGDLDENRFDFSLNVLADAEIKTYKIPLSIEYYDSYGNKYEKNDSISIDVYEAPDIELSVEKNELVIGMPSKLTVKILNKGLSDITFSEITLLNTGNYGAENSYEYIGKIESDDYDSVEFTITPKQENFIASFTVSYRDSNNKAYSEAKNIDVHAYSAREAQKLGIIKGFPWINAIVLLAIVVFIFIWRAKRKKRKGQSQGA
ncbi:MAG: hypothetical protein WC475_04250 [Candidatus Paceibacterota bacterium]